MSKIVDQLNEAIRAVDVDAVKSLLATPGVGPKVRVEMLNDCMYFDEPRLEMLRMLCASFDWELFHMTPPVSMTVPSQKSHPIMMAANYANPEAIRIILESPCAQSPNFRGYRVFHQMRQACRFADAGDRVTESENGFIDRVETCVALLSKHFCIHGIDCFSRNGDAKSPPIFELAAANCWAEVIALARRGGALTMANAYQILTDAIRCNASEVTISRMIGVFTEQYPGLLDYDGPDGSAVIHHMAKKGLCDSIHAYVKAGGDVSKLSRAMTRPADLARACKQERTAAMIMAIRSREIIDDIRTQARGVAHVK